MKALYTIILGIISLNNAFAQDINSVWAKSFPGNGPISTDLGIDIITANDGSVYSIGIFDGNTNFEQGSSQFEFNSNNGSSDIYISKMDTQGNMLWLVPIGSEFDDRPNSIALDNEGNIIVVGEFSGTVDFNPSLAIEERISAGSADIFILKLSPNGDYINVLTFGDVYSDGARGVTIDAQNQIYVTGSYLGAVDFNPGAGTSFLITGNTNTTNIFILKLDANMGFVWVKEIRVPGNGINTGVGSPQVKVDNGGNIFLAGNFYGSIDFDPGATNFILTTTSDPSSQYFYILKLNSLGSFIWVKQLGNGHPIEVLRDFEIDASGNIYFAGIFSGEFDFDPDESAVFLITPSGDTPGGFVGKLTNDGNFVWAKQFSGQSSPVDIYSIDVDLAGNAYVLGRYFNTPDFDPSIDLTFNITSTNNSDDIFVLCLSPEGNLVWGGSMGGPEYDFSGGIHADNAGNVYTTGSFKATADFNPSENIYELTSLAGPDIFIAKLSQGSSLGELKLTVNENQFIFPNPFINHLSLSFDCSVNEYATVWIVNQNGKVIFEETRKLFAGRNTLEISELDFICPGVYFVQINSCNFKFLGKVMKE